MGTSFVTLRTPNSNFPSTHCIIFHVFGIYRITSQPSIDVSRESNRAARTKQCIKTSLKLLSDPARKGPLVGMTGFSPSQNDSRFSDARGI